MPHADKYIASSPGIPHAFHMQAHLATRLGRWDKSTERSARAIELHQLYFKEMNVGPREDQQYSHHLEIATISLVHDGRFADAKAMKELAQKAGHQLNQPWFRLSLGERNWDQALQDAQTLGRRDKQMTSYCKALVYLAQDKPEQAATEIDVLRQAYQTNKTDKRLELRLWETQGRLLCMTGAGDAGVKLLERTVEKTKNDYSHHAWGNGAYYMEAWGIGALQANKLDVAEEAFLEALAHDTGSVRAALGLQVLCERQKRTEEAARYAQLAKKFWSKANPKDLETELIAMRGGSTPVQSSSR
jgi:tetratricopeptide (TPR) repeat protein